MRRRHLTEPWIPSENDPHQQLFFFLFCKIECRCWPGNSFHWSDTECKPRAACKSLSSSLCAAKPTCAACLADLSTGEQSEEQGKISCPDRIRETKQRLVGLCWPWCVSGDAWNRDGPSKNSFWLLPGEVQKAMKLGQDSQSWSFSVKLQMIWSLSQEKASYSKPCSDYTFVSSLAFLFQLC